MSYGSDRPREGQPFAYFEKGHALGEQAGSLDDRSAEAHFALCSVIWAN